MGVTVAFAAPMLLATVDLIYRGITGGVPAVMAFAGLGLLLASGFAASPALLLWVGPSRGPVAHLRYRVVAVWLMMPVLGYWALVGLILLSSAMGL